MYIPAPNDWAKKNGYNPFTPSWNRWLSAMRDAAMSIQGVAGKNITIDEHIGRGTVYNATRVASSTSAPCCYVTTIEAQVSVSGSVNCGAGCDMTFDCSFDKTWTAGVDFTGDTLCTGGTIALSYNFDASGCITCPDCVGGPPSGTIAFTMSISPVTGTSTVGWGIIFTPICAGGVCGQNDSPTRDTSWVDCPQGTYHSAFTDADTGFSFTWDVVITVS